MKALILLVWLWTATAELHNLLEIEAFINQKRLLVKKKYRPIYHVSPPAGWINAPSGFTFFKNDYHLFYQCYPYEGESGYSHWCHVVTRNFVDWSLYPIALYPEKYYDKHGCLSGTALVYNNFLTIFYTGTMGSSNNSVHTQNVAMSEDGLVFKKYASNPVIKNQSGFHPKVWRYRNVWYMLVATTEGDRGQLVLYKSSNLFNWKRSGTTIISFGDMGYLWEYPELIQIEGYYILILSVQGLQMEEGHRFRNQYQTGYVFGQFNYLQTRFDDVEVSTATFHELDYGHDFYAAKTVESFDGRTLLVAWLGMWESSFQEARYGWTSMLTLVRELSISSHGRVLMKPVRETVQLRKEVLEEAWYDPGEAFQASAKSFELIVNSSKVDDAVIILEWGDTEQYSISYFYESAYISVDRGGRNGVRRADWSPEVNGHIYWRIFVDSSSVEVFCGDGEVVFSSRIYPYKPMYIRVGGKTQLHILQYKLRRSIGNSRNIRVYAESNNVGQFV